MDDYTNDTLLCLNNHTHDESIETTQTHKTLLLELLATQDEYIPKEVTTLLNGSSPFSAISQNNFRNEKVTATQDKTLSTTSMLITNETNSGIQSRNRHITFTSMISMATLHYFDIEAAPIQSDTSSEQGMSVSSLGGFNDIYTNDLQEDTAPETITDIAETSTLASGLALITTGNNITTDADLITTRYTMATTEEKEGKCVLFLIVVSKSRGWKGHY